MRAIPSVVSWIVECQSQETMRKVKELVCKLIDLDRISVDVSIAFPGGIRDEKTEYHRLGDYFDKIYMLSQNATSFVLIFNKRCDAGYFWKDLMVEIVRSINEYGASICSTWEFADVIKDSRE
jgi:hypothetical protein